jgi:hypothetical protein
MKKKKKKWFFTKRTRVKEMKNAIEIIDQEIKIKH